MTASLVSRLVPRRRARTIRTAARVGPAAGRVHRVVWDTRANLPASPAIHGQFGCSPDPRLPVTAAVTSVTPDMGMFTVDERQLAELFRFAAGGGPPGDRLTAATASPRAV